MKKSKKICYNRRNKDTKAVLKSTVESQQIQCKLPKSCRKGNFCGNFFRRFPDKRFCRPAAVQINTEQFPFHMGKDMLFLCGAHKVFRCRPPGSSHLNCFLRSVNTRHIGEFPQPMQQSLFLPLLHSIFSLTPHQKYGILFCTPFLLGGSLRKPQYVLILSSHTECCQRTGRAERLSIWKTDSCSQFHQTLRQHTAVPLCIHCTQSFCYGLFHGRTVYLAEAVCHSGDYAQHISVHCRRGLFIANRTNGTGSILPHARQPAHCCISVREHAAVLRANHLRCFSQIGSTRVIS